jgi:tape measure domain-containing protein
MPDDRAEFRINLSAPGAKEELESAAKALGMFTREAKDADKEAERTKAGLTRFGQEFQRTSRWVEQAGNEQERFARMMTTVARAADASGLRDYNQALEYMDRHLGEVYRSGMKANEVMEALQRHASRRGEVGIAANIGGIRGWADEIRPLAAELERHPGRLSAAWGRAGMAVQVAVGNIIAATAQAAARATMDFAISGAQLAIQREALEENLRNILGSEQAMASAIARFKQAASEPGVSFDVASDKSLQLMQVGMNLEGAVRTVVEFGNAMAAAGKSEVDTAEGLQQFIQLLRKKKVTLEDLNPLMERSGYFAKALEKTYKSFGANTMDEFQKMDVAIGAFAERMVKFLGEEQRAADLTGNAVSNLRNAWSEAQAQFGAGLLGDKAKDEVNDLTEAVERLTPAFRNAGEAGNTALSWIARQAEGTMPYLERLIALAYGISESWRGIPFVGDLMGRGLDISIGKMAGLIRLMNRAGPTTPEMTNNTYGLAGPDGGGFGGLRADEARMAARNAAPVFGDDLPGISSPGGTGGGVKPIDAAKLKEAQDRKRIQNRAAYIAKVKAAEEASLSGVEMPGFEGMSTDQLRAERFRAEKIQEQDQGNTAGVWQVEQQQREAGIAKQRQELEVSQAMLQANLDQLELTQRESVARQRSATEQLAHLENIRQAKKALIEVEYELAALTTAPGMEAARGKQKTVDLAGVDIAYSADRQKILKAEQQGREEYLRGRVSHAKAEAELARVESGHGGALARTAAALQELAQFYRSTGDAVGYMRTQTELLQLQQRKGAGTIAEQILSAGPGAASISAMLKRQGVTASDLGEPGRGIWQQQATIDPSAFQSKHYRGDAPGRSDDAVAQSIADGIPGAVPSRIAALAELAAGKLLDQVIDGLGRAT